MLTYNYEDHIIKEREKEEIKPVIVERKLNYTLAHEILNHLEGVCCNWRTKEFVWEFCYDKYFK